ncbi:hypothetical protein L1887_25991 [Cichorium endivia]|nr:hypothetical protein L1887_25991 [Cichorium endivia]
MTKGVTILGHGTNFDWLNFCHVFLLFFYFRVIVIDYIFNGDICTTDVITSGILVVVVVAGASSSIAGADADGGFLSELFQMLNRNRKIQENCGGEHPTNREEDNDDIFNSIQWTQPEEGWQG